jgi:hypothetical protein
LGASLGTLEDVDALDCPSALLALELRQPDHAPTAKVKAKRLTSWEAFGKAHDV